MTDMDFKKRYAAARRAAIAKCFPRLNDMQLDAALTTEGPLLLLAGAGSGKTTVLINRIANLIEFGRGSDSSFVPENVGGDELKFLEDWASAPVDADRARLDKLAAVEPAEPWRIIAITFTNKAAEELKARLERMLGPKALDIWASTFHSACVRILRRDIDKLGLFTNSFTIYDTSDSQTLMKRIMKERELDDKKYPPRTVLSRISAAKDAMISAAEYLADAKAKGDYYRERIGELYLDYTKHMREANALDFDDLILYTVYLLRSRIEVREYYQEKFKYVLVDEYQDTNNLQYLFTSLLAGGHGNICVVGDDDQSIYKFRGATIKNILDFENQYKNARTIRLEQNYRSTAHILEAANAVIANNTERKGKTLWTNSGAGELPSLYTAMSETDEAEYVASRILEGYKRSGRWSDFAVLYRMNAQSNQLEFAFKRNGIPYRVFGGLKFFDRQEVKDMLAYLCLINNPADDLRLTRIINTPPRGIGDKTVDELAAVAAERGIPMLEAIEQAPGIPQLQKSASRLGLFAELIRDLRAAAASMPMDAFYDLVIERTGYVRALELKDTVENASRIENVYELKSNILSFIKERGTGTLAEFLDEVALYTDIDRMSADDDAAVMMTMHSAKGLEFPTVFVVGAEEGIFPGTASAMDPRELEEERRLCYVALTRAKERLYITAAHHRTLFGKTAANRLSRFVDEIPPEHIDRPERVPARPALSFDFGDGPDDRSAQGAPARKTESSWKKTNGAPFLQKSGKPAPPTRPTAPAAEKPGWDFKKGDAVLHTAFGKGLIVSVQPMGGDALLEVAFDGAGTKRLMAKTAVQHMTKV